MLEYRDKTVREVFACTCDRCGLRMSAEDFGWHEKVSLDWRGGYRSVFGDGSRVSIDLCEHCVRETLGQWLRIEPYSSEMPAFLDEDVQNAAVPMPPHRTISVRELFDPLPGETTAEAASRRAAEE